MPALGLGEAIWRSHPYTPQNYIYIHDPAVAFRARVNEPGGFGAFQSQGFPEVDMDNVTHGDISDVKAGMTVFFGTSAGARDLGWSVVREGSTSSVLNIQRTPYGVRRGECSPDDNAYITVLEHFEVWAVQPYLAVDGELYLAGTEYSDIVAAKPVAISGPDLIEWTDDRSPTGTITVDFPDGDDSYATAEGAAIASHAWDFGNGDTSTDAAPTGIVFQGGAWWVSHTVTDDQSPAQSHTTWRIVVAMYDGMPGLITEFDTVRRRHRKEGTAMDFRLLEAVDAPMGAKILYGRDEFYGKYKINLAGPTGRKNLRFSGWLDSEPTGIAAQREGVLAETTIRALDAARCAARLKAYPISFTRRTTPTAWTEMKDATVDRALHRVVMWFSTLAGVADVRWGGTGDTHAFTYFDTGGGSLWAQAEGCARNIGRELTCDQRGRIAVKANPNYQAGGDRTSTVITNLTEIDWSSIDWEAGRPPSVGIMKASAWLASTSDGGEGGVASDSLKILLIAPGLRSSLGQGDGSGESSGWIIANADEGQQRLGNMYAEANSEYGFFVVELAHTGDAGIDPALMEWITITISDEFKAQRGLTLDSGTRFLPVELDVTEIDGREGLIETATLTMQIEIRGQTAAIDDTPTPQYIPPPTGSDDPPVDVFPPGNPPVPPVPPGPPAGIPLMPLAVWGTDNKRYMTQRWAVPSPDYSSVLTLSGLTDWGGGDLLAFRFDPFSPRYTNSGTTVNGVLVTNTHCQKISDAGATTPTLSTAHAFTHDTVTRNVRYSMGKRNWILIASHKNSPTGGTTATYSTDGGSTWTEVAVSSNYEAIAYAANGDIYKPGLWLNPRVAGEAYMSVMVTTALIPEWEIYKTSNYGATWSLTTVLAATERYSAQCIDVSRQYGAAGWDMIVGSHDISFNVINQLLRLRSGAKLDISPTISGAKYGCGLAGRSTDETIAVSPWDKNIAVLVGTHTPSMGAQSFAVFHTRTLRGASPAWRLVGSASGTQAYTSCLWGSRDVFWLWGWSGNVAYVGRDFTILSKKGNLPNTMNVVGLCTVY
jgi:hypothetical protein